MDDKTHPFKISLYDTFMQKVRVESAIEILNKQYEIKLQW